MCQRKIRIHEGWKFQWTTPNEEVNFIRAAVPGPFIRPRLVKATPYIILRRCKDCLENDDCPLWKMRNGIPDPWLEYVTWRECGNKDKEVGWSDTRLNWQCLRLTDRIWNRKGLTMVQGIPDPWKINTYCMCEQDLLCEQRKKRKKKKRHKEVVKKEFRSAKEKILLSKGTKDLNLIPNEPIIEADRKLFTPQDFHAIQEKLDKLEDELKVRADEKNRKLQDVEKLIKLKAAEKKKKARRKIADVKDRPEIVEKKKPFVQEALHRTDKPSEKVTKKAPQAYREPDHVPKKIKETHSKKVPLDSKKTVSSIEPLCAGNCGRILKAQENPGACVKSCNCCCSDVDNSRAKNLRMDETPLTTGDLKKILKEMNDKIKVTKEVLSSQEDLKSQDDKGVASKAKGRERGAGEIVCRKNELFVEDRSWENDENDDEVPKVTYERVSYFNEKSINDVEKVAEPVTNPCYLDYCNRKKFLRNEINKNDDLYLRKSSNG